MDENPRPVIISMFNDQVGDIAGQNEPERYRGMSKLQIYKTVISMGKVLPSIEARCSVRTYIIGVAEGESYSIDKAELLTFEARLSPDELQRSAFYSIGSLKDKLERFLELKGKLPFNFPPGTLPDIDWFARVLRFEDQCTLVLIR